MSLRKYVPLLIGNLLIVSSSAIALSFATSLPDVHFSYSSQSCVEVINYKENQNYTCENLPQRYNHIWIE